MANESATHPNYDFDSLNELVRSYETREPWMSDVIRRAEVRMRDARTVAVAFFGAGSSPQVITDVFRTLVMMEQSEFRRQRDAQE